MSLDPKGEERRRHRRIDRHLEVRYYIGTDNNPVRVFTEDISQGGIRIQNPFPIDEHYRFPIRITLNPETNLEIKAIARVAWQRKKPDAVMWEMGIEFIQIQDGDLEIIKKFLEEVG
jgi:c-di-GMP-binding flagellar brake protein YcgR